MRRAVSAMSSLSRLQVRVQSSNLSTMGTESPQTAVFNQVPPCENLNLFESDKSLMAAVLRNGGKWGEEHLSMVGRMTGSSEALRLAEQANRFSPTLLTHDRVGNRVDVVEFHPAYHELMKLGMDTAQNTSLVWRNDDKEANYTIRSAVSFMLYQMESGTQCPQTMTFAVYPALLATLTQKQRNVGWLGKLASGTYDARDLPISFKDGATFGMSMTERQGGSDVRANITVATPCDELEKGAGTAYLLNGHKWFTSAPMCDAFLTLAHTPEGVSCFIVPRWNPYTHERNLGLRFNRLKEKLGDHSNASSEIEYHNAWAEMLGPPGKGIQTILTMVQHTRLDCVVGSAGLIRKCVVEALHHTAHRKAFGKVLNQSPIMANVLADLVVESEAATVLAFRVAESFDKAHKDVNQAMFSRIATAIAKYHICKRATGVAYESMECIGGNGYIEEGVMPRLFRQAPLNAIWEGSGNVICLDVLRAMSKNPESLTAVVQEIHLADGLDTRFDDFSRTLAVDVANIATALKNNDQQQLGSTRRVVGALAIALQGSLLLRFSDKEIANAFCASRLSSTGATRGDYGTLPAEINCFTIVQNSTPSFTLPSSHL